MKKIVVNWDRCEANAVCMKTAPHMFNVDDKDVMTVLVESPTTPEDIALAEKAVKRCPKRALELVDVRRGPVLVGVLRLVFHVPAARSLKEKRAVVRKFRDRVRARHDVSIAEVADQDLHQRATFGVAVVSSDAAVIDEVLEAVAREAGTQPDAILVDRSTEIVSMGEG